MSPTVRAMIMPIKHQWAELIYDGKKTMEVRKLSIRKWTLPCLLYESGPVKRVTGVMWFSTKQQFDHLDVMQMSDACLSRAQYEEYVGIRQSYGYRIKEVRRFEQPLTLEELGITNVPMTVNYCEIPEEVVS